ncbi:T-lymphocyte surface antigen Ly-9 isoform X2 [Sciurus carolinensis]|uniref:T-lymphocyte surface antigen Ly-9 isoform X2 n=1 Tax=Sciurus carolinensis TaxID=30640 RepID=UPI001FB1F1D0|nr:T-lymphocyte surface antigen Ly-9 isoform X2 [Sciurus carolinensis]
MIMEGPKNHADNWAVGVFFNKPQESQPQMRSVLWTSLFFLFMGLGSSEKDSTPMVVSGILGGSVTLPLNISVDTEIENVAWTGLNEALVLARPKGDLTFLVKSYENRINISGNYSLYIRNLTQKDAGSYKAQVNQKNSEVTAKKEFILHVYEHVQEPQVTVKSIIMSENASCNITLMCSVKGSENGVLYSWTQRDTNTSESYTGSILTISPKLCDPDLSYTCTARNPVSQSSSRPVQAWHFCTGTSSINTMGETVVGTLGEPFTLPLALPVSQDTENIVWKFNTSLISKEWKGAAMADPLIKPNGSDESRVWVSSQDYSLKISQLKMEDAGPYHAYGCSEASRVTSMRHVILLVYRRLRKPNVTWRLMHTEDGICRLSLTCSVEDSGNNVTYTWSPMQKGAIVSQEGSHLNVSWRSNENHPNLTCTARNPVSSSSHQFLSRNICSGPKENKLLWIWLSPGFILPLLGIFSWYMWKKRRWCSVPAFGYSQAEVPADTPGYEKLDILPKTANHWSRPTSDTSSSSNITTEEEDEERTPMHSSVNGKDEVYDWVTQDVRQDSAPEGQTEYVILDDTAVGSVVEGDLEYMQVVLNLQEKNSAPQKKESSVTIYCSIQKPQKVVPPPQQDDLESSEIPTYENFT